MREVLIDGLTRAQFREKVRAARPGVTDDEFEHVWASYALWYSIAHWFERETVH